MSRFEATQGLFWTGLPHFELWSDNEDDTSPPLQIFASELSWSFATALLHANGILTIPFFNSAIRQVIHDCSTLRTSIHYLSSLKIPAFHIKSRTPNLLPTHVSTRQSKWSDGYPDQWDIQPSAPILGGFPHCLSVLAWSSRECSTFNRFRGLFWNPRLGWELGWVPHVNNRTQPNRGYQNRPLNMHQARMDEFSDLFVLV
ncbi:hypothetical protein AVEN_112589-1 [Araneus ventricosus]|uniref:Uncharacterized protein n=1 Tax=Araneus ventricosus TaxID=182803 RepID=A0A4Y2L3S6_ARAVE|nr:hypothetical protein AVEN_112589-1 [Araneus ventricosus]